MFHLLCLFVFFYYGLGFLLWALKSCCCQEQGSSASVMLVNNKHQSGVMKVISSLCPSSVGQAGSLALWMRIKA